MHESPFHSNAVFFVEVEKIRPNPFQPRKEFDEAKLKDLADSVRMYGILQPLVVTRKEFTKDDGGIGVEYELIAGERRLRASRLAGLREVPVLIRAQEDDDRVKLELAIIENLQREDLNPVDRARSFQQLAEQFGLKHIEIAQKVGKSREYVSNTMRLLALPEDILDALGQGKISEGHTRPLLMLSDRKEEQNVLFREIMLKKMTVRDAEKIARKIAFDKVRKKERMFNPDIVELEQQVSDSLGTRVHIEPREVGGRIQIDYFNEDDLKQILAILNARQESMQAAPAPTAEQIAADVTAATALEIAPEDAETSIIDFPEDAVVAPESAHAPEEALAAARQDEDEQTYSLNSFTI
ncbi:MAG: chromosome partitioning protein ParB, chromosome partitioning protein ParB family [Candidatus Parcubacteria bacterium]|jgi:ParB family chromosome partitioning protein